HTEIYVNIKAGYGGAKELPIFRIDIPALGRQGVHPGIDIPAKGPKLGPFFHLDDRRLHQYRSSQQAKAGKGQVDPETYVLLNFQEARFGLYWNRQSADKRAGSGASTLILPPDPPLCFPLPGSVTVFSDPYTSSAALLAATALQYGASEGSQPDGCCGYIS